MILQVTLLSATIPLLVVTAAVAMLFRPVAFARADLVGADPPVGATLATAPSMISLTFSDRVDVHLSTIVVVDDRNQRVEQGAVEATGYGAKTLRIAVRPLTAGVYRVIWHAVSWDRSKTKGRYEFTIKP
jgi:methionine-rich copper-binding protein CopC